MEEQFLFGISLFGITLPGNMAGGVGGRSGRSEMGGAHCVRFIIAAISRKRLISV